MPNNEQVFWLTFTVIAAALFVARLVKIWLLYRR